MYNYVNLVRNTLAGLVCNYTLLVLVALSFWISNCFASESNRLYLLDHDNEVKFDSLDDQVISFFNIENAKAHGFTVDLAYNSNTFYSFKTPDIYSTDLDFTNITRITGVIVTRSIYLEVNSVAYIYYIEYSQTTVNRLKLSDGSVELIYASDQSSDISDLVVDTANNKIYIALMSGELTRVNFDGSGKETIDIDASENGGNWLAYHDQYIYIASTDNDLVKTIPTNNFQESELQAIHNSLTVSKPKKMEIGPDGTIYYISDDEKKIYRASGKDASKPASSVHYTSTSSIASIRIFSIQTGDDGSTGDDGGGDDGSGTGGDGEVIDNCPNDPFKTTPGDCGCGIPDVDTEDTPDGYPDCSDQCQGQIGGIAHPICGCDDTVTYNPLYPDNNGCEPVSCTNCYGDSDKDGAPDGPLGDPDTDLCPTDPNKQKPGVCGCGLTKSSLGDCREEIEFQSDMKLAAPFVKPEQVNKSTIKLIIDPNSRPIIDQLTTVASAYNIQAAKRRKKTKQKKVAETRVVKKVNIVAKELKNGKLKTIKRKKVLVTNAKKNSIAVRLKAKNPNNVLILTNYTVHKQQRKKSKKKKSNWKTTERSSESRTDISRPPSSLVSR